MTALVVFLAIGAGSYALRASMFLVLADRSVPPWAERAMGLVGPAAIAALVASAMLTADGAVRAAPVAELLAVAAGFYVVRRTGNVLHALALGFPIIWIATALGL
jgi:branched-subunit amino acid transport protein